VSNTKPRQLSLTGIRHRRQIDLQHNVQRVAAADGAVRNDSDVQVPVEPYEIPYRVILPKQAQADNLLVPVCLSASHVAYSSVRMEPQYIIIGQAAGTAAALALKGNIAVQAIDISLLQKELCEKGAILHLDQQVLPEDFRAGVSSTPQ
jgi:hypothetical protein